MASTCSCHCATRSSRRPSAALVVATLALFLSLGGTSYAAVKAGSVGTKQLATNSVTASKIRTNAVGSSELVTGSVGASEIVAGAVRASELGTGSVTESKIALDAVTGLAVRLRVRSVTALDLQRQRRSGRHERREREEAACRHARFRSCMSASILPPRRSSIAPISVRSV